MYDDIKGHSDATSRKELGQIFRLANVTSNDIFCDLGCGDGNLCRWAIKKVSFAVGTEDDKNRFRNAKKRTRKFEDVKILNKNYHHKKTLQYLRDCSIFYSTNDLGLGFFKKFEKIMKHKTCLVTYGLPPYPVKPDCFIGWFYLSKTPFKIAKSKKEWINSISKGNESQLVRKIKNKFGEEDALGLEEDFEGIDWIKSKK